MGEYLEAFSLGNAAILGNVCMLPLYPALMVMLANRPDGRSRATPWLGVVVLAGVVSCMVAIGFALHALSATAADVLGWLLPVMYGAVVLFGIAMLLGKNPFTTLGAGVGPSRGPVASAYVYGLLLAPMTLPCTGPLIVSAFVLGGVAGAGALGEALWYFVWFSLGFGWPLVVLPFLATPVQRRATRFLTRHHRAIGAVSGLLLVAVGAFGFWYDVRPA